MATRNRLLGAPTRRAPQTKSGGGRVQRRAHPAPGLKPLSGEVLTNTSDAAEGAPLSQAVQGARRANGADEFVARLADLRLEKGLTYKQLERRCRLSRSSAHVMLTTRRLPRLDQLLAFLDGCGVSAEERMLWWSLFRRVQVELPPVPIMMPALPRSEEPPARTDEPAPKPVVPPQMGPCS